QPHHKPMIEEPVHPAGHLGDRRSKETTMLKTISAALLVASVFVAPAMAGTARTGHTPAVKSVTLKQSVLNANAKMGRHHHHHRRPMHRHHRHHKHH
ncbi:MAG: His-rich protein BRANT, partial [Nitrobacter sp.]